ncbi:MAG: FMN-binding protein [Clostridiaceae bacterium]|nr:FMN-binding protein [Clostridiaceae bacterium]
MKKILKILLAVFGIFMLISVSGLFFLSRGLEAGSHLIVNDVNAPMLTDGTYNGRYEGGRWTNEVEVIIKDHKIMEIIVIKDILLVKEEVTEELFQKILKEQSINVDAISGATVTSKAYLKAIENALVQ